MNASRYQSSGRQRNPMIIIPGSKAALRILNLISWSQTAKCRVIDLRRWVWEASETHI